jgi:hypothetical protein
MAEENAFWIAKAAASPPQEPDSLASPHSRRCREEQRRVVSGPFRRPQEPGHGVGGRRLLRPLRCSRLT